LEMFDLKETWIETVAVPYTGFKKDLFLFY
jgi:hypothetical protein